MLNFATKRSVSRDRQQMSTVELSLLALAAFAFFCPAAIPQTQSKAVAATLPVTESKRAVEDTASVDFTDWSVNRIKAYKESLEMDFPSPLAILAVPRLGVHVSLFEGTDDVTLDRGVGRIAGTAPPGTAGNLGVAGHRDGFFRPLKDIKQGDTIKVITPSALATYNVDRIEIVDPTDIRVLKPGTKTTLTLVTCYPFYFIGHAPKRFIVEASLVQFTRIP
jgi:sortase A